MFLEEGLEAGADLGFGDMMNQNTDSQSDSQSDRSSNSGEVIKLYTLPSILTVNIVV